MDRILKWGSQRNGRPWYYNNENSKLVIRDVPQTNEIKPITSNHNPPVVKMKMQISNQVKKIEKKEVKIDEKKVEPEWKQDEQEISLLNQQRLRNQQMQMLNQSYLSM